MPHSIPNVANAAVKLNAKLQHAEANVQGNHSAANPAHCAEQDYRQRGALIVIIHLVKCLKKGDVRPVPGIVCKRIITQGDDSPLRRLTSKC